MVDIAKCDGTSCVQKDTCYRFTSEAGKFRQAYMYPEKNDKGDCKHYWGVEV